ncbi:DUF5336 domain-containing protein [Actinophytocola sp.]|uniref:DUF5336 domain-containing protein n=1 Tax=Actinophytocola sp. TaxID=1872138 RepID=UPI003D6BDCFC
MTYPGGAPGGYPGQGPQQPLQGPGYGPPPGSGTKLGLPQIIFLVVGGLGLINFFVGFADIFDGANQSFFAAPTPVPALFLLGGLFVVPAIMPGGAKAGIAPAAFSVTGMLTVLFFTFATDPDLGVGSILMLIFGILQGAASVVAYLFEVGIMKAPTPGQAQGQYGQQPPMYPPSGQFPQQQQPPPGQYPPAPGQQTTFAPQQGQFGQPGQQPGTPPGGYPQQ